MDRRTLLRSAGLIGLGATVARSTLGSSAATAAPAAARSNPLAVAKYRALVPEIFTPLADAPGQSSVLVVGTGFGGAVAALRLAQAGVDVTLLERGSRWPIPSPYREIFSPDATPDGRAVWRQTSSLALGPLTLGVDYFGGVLDAVQFDGIKVLRGAGVGGGSLVYTGVHLVPERQRFAHLFGSTVPWAEMAGPYATAASMLGTSTMPNDIYASDPYTHSRIWDGQIAKAGLISTRTPGVWDWNVMRKELRWQTRPSAVRSESNYGNSNGVKRGLQLNYLAQAEATGRARIFPGHEVLSIGQDPNGRYTLDVHKVAPTGEVLSSRTLTCDHLVLSAGSIGTTELLMRARATGALPNLNEHIGQGWGTNGDAMLYRSSSFGGITQGAASASYVTTEVNGMPITMENWMTAGTGVNLGVISSLGMAFDDTRADFTWGNDNAMHLRWPGQPDAIAAFKSANRAIAAAAGVSAGAAPILKDVEAEFTAHPLGGAVIGKATDAYGRVLGHPKLYVADGSLVPGNTGAVNPSLTITALAERNMAEVISAGG